MSQRIGMTLQRILLWVALTLNLIHFGCGDLKKVEEMRRATQEMNQTTKDLLEETKDLHRQTEALQDETAQVKEQTADLGHSTDQLVEIARDRLGNQLESLDRGFGELYDSLRQGDSATLRRASFDRLLDAKTISNRIAEAGLFVMAFEFQLFNGAGPDLAPQRKDVLYQQAMMELFLRLDEIAPPGDRVWPLASPRSRRHSSENRTAAFNSLAVALHKINRKQAPATPSQKPVSLYSLIIEALRLKAKLDDGEQTLPQGPHFAKEVLSRPSRVRQLLQTRYNMFAPLFLASTTDFMSKGLIPRFLHVARGVDLSLNDPDLDSAHLDFIIEDILKPAVQTARDMRSVGITPQMTKSIRLLTSRIHFRGGPQESSFLGDRQAQVRALWSEFLSDTSSSFGETSEETEN